MSSASTTKRPFGVVILAALSLVLAVTAAGHVLQALGLMPFFIGPFAFRTFSLFGAIMYGLLVWVYIWLAQMLWSLDQQAWLFLAIITVFNLTLSFVMMLGQAQWNDVSIDFLINAVILIYIMLPSVRNAFQTQ